MVPASRGVLAFLGLALLLAVLDGSPSSAQDLPVVAPEPEAPAESPAEETTSGHARGDLEVQVGIAGITLPEGTGGTWSMQPLGRVGFFLARELELQVEGGYRIWPLGPVAPKSLSLGGNILWHPSVLSKDKSLYLLAGLATYSADPPGGASTEWNALGRGALGFRVPLENLGFLSAWQLSVEFRSEYVLEDERDLVSGAAVGFSYFL
jgi:hypothetical protein